MSKRNIPDAIVKAVKLAEKFRYAADRDPKAPVENDLRLGGERAFFSQNYLKITEHVTPSLSRCLNKVYDRLAIAPDYIDAYVYPSSKAQAGCLSTGYKDCIIRFSSGLIGLLDDEEIEFVAGHEIGHFLLGHGNICQHNDKDIEFLINKRAQELSADRIGYISCGSLDIAIRTLMKTMSGLSSKYLRFDVSNFIDQIRDVDKHIELTTYGYHPSTHPSILIRCRALVWFSLAYDNEHERMENSELVKINNMIIKDMDKYVDGEQRSMLLEAQQQVKLWERAYEIVCKGAFTKEDQVLIKDDFGEQKLESLRNYLGSFSKVSAKDEILARLEEAQADLRKMAPHFFQGMSNIFGP